MYCHNRKSIFVLVLVLVWGQQTRSQDDVPPPQPIDPMVNGHTAISVGTREQQMRLDGVTSFVSGPTGVPVWVQEGQPGLPEDAGFPESPTGSSLPPSGGTPDGSRGYINAPTGFSVEAAEHRPDAITGLVNGPTGISVQTEQRSDGVTDIVDDLIGNPVEVEQTSDVNDSTSNIAETEENDGSEGVSGLVDGPAGVPVGVEELGSDGVTRFVNDPSLTHVEEPNSGRVIFVNGPTGISVEAEEEQRPGGVSVEPEEPSESSVGTGQELSRSSNRGVLSTAPEEAHHTKQQLPAGLHIDTADWSKDSAYYSFKGGEWSLVHLPDPSHPGIPAPEVPGPALVVVTHNPLKKVYVLREVDRLTNLTLHYRFFLTEGKAPHGVPELKVYQVVGNSSQLLATETTRGVWSDSTVHLPKPGPFKLTFEGRLNMEGNEIAIDDVTISGISDGGQGLTEGMEVLPSGDAADAALPPDADVEEGPTVDTTAGQITQHANETLDTPESTQQGVAHPEDILTSVVNQETEITGNPDVAGELSKETEATEIPSDAELVTPAGGMEEAEGGGDSRNNMTSVPVLIPTPVDSIPVDEELLNRENETAPLNSMPDSIVLRQENGTVVPPFITDSEQGGAENEAVDGELISEGSQTDLPTTDSEMVNSENETLLSTTTNDELISQGNNTEAPLETTLDFESTMEPEVNTSVITDPRLSTDVLSLPIAKETSPLDNTALSSTGESAVTHENLTQPPTSDETSVRTSITPEGNIAPGNNLGGLLDDMGPPEVSHIPVSTTSGTSPKKTTVVTSSSASPSGSTNTSAPGAPMTRTPWGVFQIFLVLCLLGAVVLGFLYWRKKRRQDDEIPVFTRSSHTDYHNPTFSPDDDSSFASYGARHNYKSFE